MPPRNLILQAPLKRVHWRVDPFSCGVMSAAVAGLRDSNRCAGGKHRDRGKLHGSEAQS